MLLTTLLKCDVSRCAEPRHAGRAALCIRVFGLLPIVLFALAGCAHVNNPYRDSSAAIEDEMTTPSTEGHRGHAEFGRQARRDYPVSEVRYENCAVSHWPLWWEDPFEDQGNRTKDPADRDAPDNEFAWNWVDYLHIAYGPARMVFVNTAGWPISAIITPPGTLMESNGRIDQGLVWYDHDAKRSDSVTREPPDVNIIDKNRNGSLPPVEEPESTDTESPLTSPEVSPQP